MALPSLAGLRVALSGQQVPIDNEWDELPSELKEVILSMKAPQPPRASARTTFSPRSMWGVHVTLTDPENDDKRLAVMTVEVDQTAREYSNLEPVTARILVTCTPGYSGMGDRLRQKALGWRNARALPGWRINQFFDDDPRFATDSGAHDYFEFDTNAENGLPADADYVEIVGIEFDLRGVERMDRALCDEAIDILFECCPNSFSVMLDKLVERYDAVFEWERQNPGADGPVQEMRFNKARSVHTLIHRLRRRWTARMEGERPEPTARTRSAFPRFSSESESESD